MIYFSLSIIKSFTWVMENILQLLICFNSSVLLGRLKDFKALICFSFCFSKTFVKREYLNLACCIIWPRPECSISSNVSYSNLSILHDDNADIFTASLLIS